MTEDEAKTKWCPFARTSCASEPITGNHAANRYSSGQRDGQGAHNCIGSACMAWRQIRRWSDPFMEQPGSHGGYCGLAGKPE